MTPTVAVVGTDLAPIRHSSGALERVLLGWASARAGAVVTLVDADGPPGSWAARIGELAPDLVVLNNRPLWAERVVPPTPVLHLLHNYPDAWGEGSEDADRVRAALEQGTVGAVSRALADKVAGRYGLAGAVHEVRVGVEEGFFQVSWHGAGGPVLFPNRLLEKKGVRLFFEIARGLSAQGLRCVMFRHLAPWSEPTAEQRALLYAAGVAEEAGYLELLDPPPSRPAMARWYAAAGVVLCPSIRPEGLGLVALEAQAVGAPLVTSGQGGLAEATFPPNEVVHEHDPDRWCEAALRAARRPAELVRATAPARLVRERYGGPAAARSWLEVVRAALSTAGRPAAG